jgi:hypothetical protein
MSKGYVILAFNNATTDYVSIAGTLCRSIHRVMPDALVSLITSSDVVDPQYDHIIKVDEVDSGEWKLGNDWLIYENTPYERTIKLEADMIITRDISWWWDVLEKRDLNVCTTIRDFRGKISYEDYYRNPITKNNLPNAYNAITYFKKSPLAKQFYDCVAQIFEHWSELRTIYYGLEHSPTTDTVYAIAMSVIGEEHCSMPNFTDFSFTHMKQHINGLHTKYWDQQLMYELLPHTVRINTYPQMYPLHYHVKSFANKIDEALGK